MEKNKINSSRQKLSAIAIIICSLLVNGYMLIENIRFPENTRQNISKYEKRFNKLRQLLPQRGVIGYIADDENEGDQDFIDSRIYLAQYTLAPVILVRSLDYDLIVGNFLDHTRDFEIYRKQGLIPIKDFGNGVVLFKRELK